MMRQKTLDILEKRNVQDAEVVFALSRELEQGIQSMKQGNVYTVEEAWKEIDAI